MFDVSEDTKAILLLTAPLMMARKASPGKILSLGEYQSLGRHLVELGCTPKDLLARQAESLVEKCGSVIDAERLRSLLSRGFLLSQAIERWRSRAIWVISRADEEYPKRIKNRLRERAPAVLYGCGDLKMVQKGGLAVVGSRTISEEVNTYTKRVGRLAAKAGVTIISGGARGSDIAAMSGAFDAGGEVVGVLAEDMEKAVLNREFRDRIIAGQLVLVSPFDPNSHFFTGNAMQRNKLIYTLADAALVVNSDYEKGGTWSGAVEQLKKYGTVPLFVRQTGEYSKGLKELRNKGAIAWPEPQTTEDMRRVFNVPLPKKERQNTLFEFPAAPKNGPEKSGEKLRNAVREILGEELLFPMNEREVAKLLDITNSQSKKWLEYFVETGFINVEASHGKKYYRLNAHSLPKPSTDIG